MNTHAVTEDGQQRWFTSDTHFGHANVIGYCGRPFANLDEMHHELIARWNARVQPGDIVYHLGDFAFGPKEFGTNICALLAGRKVLIRGNHDGGVKRMLDVGFSDVVETALIPTPRGMFRLSHVPPDGADRDGLKVYIPSADEDVAGFLCGHVHEKWATKGKCINVGVDVRGFEPKTIDELLESANG